MKVKKTKKRKCEAGFCEHGKRKHRCKECGGCSICEHGREKYHCKECGGSAFCEHGKRKSHCKECGGGSICEHGRQKYHCKECGGSAFCEHGKEKWHCKECGGSAFCEHGKQKSYCKECGGSAFCEHGKQKRRCEECGGFARLRKECYLKKKGGYDGKYTEDMSEDMLLEKWSKLLDLQVELLNPGETAALVEMRKMCPGKPAILEEIEEACRETSFRTPFWKGRMDMPERILLPAEVDVINRKYLELKAAFDAKGQSRDGIVAIGEAE
jgi:hypothetical protein